MRVVPLTAPLQILIPALLLPSVSKSTRGFTLYPGRTGLAIGSILLACGVILGALLAGSTIWVGTILSVWLFGTVGAAMVVSGLSPTAFVKPLCLKCRLLPVIKEHEAIHLLGVSSEKAVWDSMKTRHSVESLALEGDPTICSFCPIPKRLAEH